MTLLRHPLIPALLAVLAAGPAWSQATAPTSAPLLVADALLDCRAALARDPAAPGPLLGSKGWDCSMLSATASMALLRNCDTQHRGEPLPHAEAPFAGRTARPPSSEAAIRAFVAWAESHPERGRDLAAAGFAEAAAEAFQCRS